MRKQLVFTVAALAAFALFGFTPTAHTNVVTRSGVTYVQRGALGNGDYVVTNVQQTADDVGALPSTDRGGIHEVDCYVAFNKSPMINEGGIDFWSGSIYPTDSRGFLFAYHALDSHLLPDGTDVVTSNYLESVLGRRKVNNHPLSSDVSVTYADVGALPENTQYLKDSTAFGTAVRYHSPTVTLPTYWYLGNITNWNGCALYLTDDFSADIESYGGYVASAKMVYTKSVLKDSAGYLKSASVNSGNTSLTLTYGDNSTEVTFTPTVSMPNNAVILDAGDVVTYGGTKITASHVNAVADDSTYAAVVAKANAAVPNTRTINGHQLNADISTATFAADVKAVVTKNYITNDLGVAEMDYPAMTNTVNEVKAQFYDEQLHVTWTVKMVNGDMKLYATTNINNSTL